MGALGGLTLLALISGQGRCVRMLLGLDLNPHLFVFERDLLLSPAVTGWFLSPDVWEGGACAGWEEEVGSFASHEGEPALHLHFALLPESV